MTKSREDMAWKLFVARESHKPTEYDADQETEKQIFLTDRINACFDDVDQFLAMAVNNEGPMDDDGEDDDEGPVAKKDKKVKARG